MNVPMSWLKEYVNINCDTKAFADAMTMSGSKVEAIVKLGEKISSVVVGRIESIEKHPKADKLVITQVAIAPNKTIQIVTGATNLTVGDYVPVALDGSTIANGKTIVKGELRGEISDGMLCSIEELGYTKQDYPEAPENGIYVFATSHPLGSDVRPILQLCEDVVEFEITSNRPDCFSVLGLAREAAATFCAPFQPPNVTLLEKGTGDISQMVSVEIQNPTLCPRYAARVIQNVTIKPSPLWLAHRLTASGIRPINNIVDITNYVMLEMGQPMHAFDIDQIANKKIIVRNAHENETFKTLDGELRALDPSMLVIADEEKAVAIAGIMGGENSKITGTASAVLLESANFNATNVRVTSKKLGLRTDASSKFEKGIDPNLALLALNRAAFLVEQLACADVVKGVVDCYPAQRNPWSVSYSVESINRLLGTNLQAEEMEAYWQRVEIIAKNGTAQIPTFRPDILCEADLAEEVARLYGYDNIPTTLAVGTPTVGKKTKTQILEDLAKKTIASLGFSEALTYAFESPKVFERLNISPQSKLKNTVNILNPLGEDYSIMRTQTVSSMLVSLANNFNKRNESAKLFELAKIYEPNQNDLPTEKKVLTLAMFGEGDYFDMKGAIETLACAMGLPKLEFFREENNPFMHPGATATFAASKTPLGYVGEVHPSVLATFGIGTKAYLAVIDADQWFLQSVLVKAYEPIPKFPSVKRDIAMVVSSNMLVKDIEACICEVGGQWLDSVKLFDVYTGNNLPAGTKSVAYRISFRDAQKTLTDEEIAPIMKQMVTHLEEKLGAQLRAM